MESPFPGMDPWLEGHVWPDVHHGLAFVFKEQLVSRGDRFKTEVWAMTVRDKLPVVPIPLKSPDPDVRLDIGAAFNEVYSRSRYELSVRYDVEPPPPAFLADELQELQGILKEKKLLS